MYNAKFFTEGIINAVWNKGSIVPGYDPNLYRKDVCGAWMKKTLHGQTVRWGWEIDHTYPSSMGGSDNLSNLQPLQWENNREKGGKLSWSCKVKI